MSTAKHCCIAFISSIHWWSYIALIQFSWLFFSSFFFLWVHLFMVDKVAISFCCALSHHKKCMSSAAVSSYDASLFDGCARLNANSDMTVPFPQHIGAALLLLHAFSLSFANDSLRLNLHPMFLNPFFQAYLAVMNILIHNFIGII